MCNSFAAALALIFVLEGLMPFLAPSRWRATFQRILALRDGQIRFFGLTSMVVGVIVLVLTDWF